MPEPQDPLRSLFQHAAESGRKQTAAAPAASITARAKRSTRRRVTAAVTALCLALGGAATALVLLPDRPASQSPADTPSPDTPTPSKPTTAPTTQPPPPPHDRDLLTATDGRLIRLGHPRRNPHDRPLT
ncbi:hypothetical protein [Streptomyces venezuelae]|uniref:hypothetical protein n=1 Tax=Streptomyces venezuelae TaxID=54571 RepID=UPI0036530A94